MAWTTPRTWVTAEIVDETMMNTHVRDNLRYLKGIDGAITIQDSVTLQGSLNQTGTASYIRVAVLTTTQRDALTGTNGVFIYNSTTNKFEKYEDGAWRADLAYDGTFTDMQLPGQVRGDIIFCGTAGTAWERLPAGTTGQYLKTQGTAANPAWQTAVGLDNLVSGKTPTATGWTSAPGSLTNITDEDFATVSGAGTGGVLVETNGSLQVQIDLGASYPTLAIYCKVGIWDDAGLSPTLCSIRAGTAGNLTDTSVGTASVTAAAEGTAFLRLGTLLEVRYITMRTFGIASGQHFKGYEVLCYGKAIAIS